jgi:hypothetical protein
MFAKDIIPGTYVTKVAGIPLESLLVEDNQPRQLSGMYFTELTLWSPAGMVTLTVSPRMEAEIVSDPRA